MIISLIRVGKIKFLLSSHLKAISDISYEKNFKNNDVYLAMLQEKVKLIFLLSAFER